MRSVLKYVVLVRSGYEEYQYSPLDTYNEDHDSYSQHRRLRANFAQVSRKGSSPIKGSIADRSRMIGYARSQDLCV